MELISMLVLALLGIIGAGLSKVIADEFKDWSPWIVDWLIRRAVRRMPRDLQERSLEEWKSHIKDVPGSIGKILSAISLQSVAYQLEKGSPYIQRFIAFVGVFLLFPLLVLIAIAAWDPKSPGLLERVQADEDFEDSRDGMVTVFKTSGPLSHLFKGTGLERLPYFIDVVQGRANFNVSKTRIFGRLKLLVAKFTGLWRVW